MMELDCKVEMPPRGMFLDCPNCQQELRINKKYVGQQVSCKHCEGTLMLDLARVTNTVRAYYGDCPHCQKELRIGKKYTGVDVVCKFCGGKIKLVT